MVNPPFKRGDLVMTKQGPDNEVISGARHWASSRDDTTLWTDVFLKTNELCVFLEERRIPRKAGRHPGVDTRESWCRVLSRHGPVWVPTVALRQVKP